VREYFNALEWDGRPRLETWLVTYFHADDSPYVRAVGPRFPISVVARIHEPGCQVDHMPVLEGPQGQGKSTALRIMAIKPDWFSDRISNVGSKDAAIETVGVLLFEMAELVPLLKASSSTSKSFITRRYEYYRPPYGKHSVRLPRQCVFAGSINPPVDGYLTDPTGSRRIWPVTCHGMVDRDGIERDRDQLWAEAVAQYRAGKKWWLETPELEALAKAEQALRFKSDPWTEPIKKWLNKNKKKRRDVTLGEVLKGALKIPTPEQNQSAKRRVASILTEILSLEEHRPRRKGSSKRPRRYWRP
jgi:predicted P-loop ATPase